MKYLAFFAALFFAVASNAPAAIKRDPLEILRESQEAFEKRDFDRAIELLTKAIESDPKLAPARVLRGFAYAAKDEYDKAIADYSEALKLKPDDERPLTFRAATYMAKKDWKGAIQDFTAILKKKPDDTEALLSRGMCHAQDDDNDKAFEDFDRAVKREPKNSRALQLRASIFADKGNKAEALADYKAAIESDPNDAATYLYRAQLYLIEDEPEKALADFEELMTRAPNYSGAANDYAWTLATNPNDKVRNGRKAVEFAKKACYETDYKHAPTLDTLAAAYAEAAEWDDAIRWQSEAAKLAEKSNPDDVEGMKSRLQLYKDKKPYRENPKEEFERRKKAKKE